MAVPFIKEHFEALSRFTNGYLLHVEVKQVPGRLLSIRHEQVSETEESYIAFTSINIWRIIEIVSLVLLLFAISKHGVKRYDIINFHVGYPNLTYFNIVKKLIRKPFILIEHWTAFHYEFNMTKGTMKLDRIRNIYRQQFPLVVVSKWLGADIEQFAQCPQERLKVIPNVVDSSVFYYDPGIPAARRTFFMVNYWRDIKDPFPVLRAFSQYLERRPDAELRIGGYGPLWNRIVDFVKVNRLERKIILLGKLRKSQIADEMRKATALVHHADYETFSVVCAESVSCGCPVIINYLEAVAEFIDDSNGILIRPDESYLEVLLQFNPASFDRSEIARNAHARFNPDKVGRDYYEFNLQVSSEFRYQK